VYVNTGLILAADEEAELAGVLAHETAHVAARHGAETASKQMAANLATIPLIFVGGVAGLGARQATGLVIPVSLLKFTRSQEAEADFLGTQYMYKAGYDPSAMLSFFEKLQAKERVKPGTMSKLFTDHPPTADRIAAIKQEIQTILPGHEQYVVSTSEFNTIKARLISLQNPQPAKDDNNPVLRRRPATASAPAPPPADPNPPTGNDDGPPPLKRKN
jgi:predicted Zn-dependent protease